MAKKEAPKFKYPSQHGSHKTMVDEAKTEALGNPNKCVCVDQYGDYITDINRLDNGEIDWNRANGERVKIEKEKGKGKK
jgi:hypothetical protein